MVRKALVKNSLALLIAKGHESCATDHTEYKPPSRPPGYNEDDGRRSFCPAKDASNIFEYPHDARNF